MAVRSEVQFGSGGSSRRAVPERVCWITSHKRSGVVNYPTKFYQNGAKATIGVAFHSLMSVNNILYFLPTVFIQDKLGCPKYP